MGLGYAKVVIVGGYDDTIGLVTSSYYACGSEQPPSPILWFHLLYVQWLRVASHAVELIPRPSAPWVHVALSFADRRFTSL